MMNAKPSVSLSSKKYGPWAVIAGGSEGIGACIARQLAKSGINLILVARKVEPLETVAASIRSETSVEVRILALDLTDAALLGGFAPRPMTSRLGCWCITRGPRTGRVLSWIGHWKTY